MPRCGAARVHICRGDLAGQRPQGAGCGVTHVFHLAAQAGVRKSWGRRFRRLYKNNVEATQRLLEALVGVPIQKYVYASSSSVYGDNVPLPMREDTYLQPLSPYGVSKLAAEHLGHLYWENHGVPAVSLRYFTVYGPRQRPDMGFQRFLTAVKDRQPHNGLRRWRADTGLHVRLRHRRRQPRGRRTRHRRARVQYWLVAPGSR